MYIYIGARKRADRQRCLHWRGGNCDSQRQGRRDCCWNQQVCVFGMCVCAHTHVRACVRVYVNVHVYVCASSTGVFVCVCVCVCTRAFYRCESVSVCVSMYLCLVSIRYICPHICTAHKHASPHVLKPTLTTAAQAQRQTSITYSTYKIASTQVMHTYTHACTQTSTHVAHPPHPTLPKPPPSHRVLDTATKKANVNEQNQDTWLYTI